MKQTKSNITGLKGNLPTALISSCQKMAAFFYVETKGRFTVSDRQKHLLIKEQCPDIEIRFVFSNQNSKLYKGSKTSYAQWCEKHGFQYAHKTIPDDWLQCEGDKGNEPESKDTDTPS